jgi:hypothetical protein
MNRNEVGNVSTAHEECNWGSDIYIHLELLKGDI